MSGPRLLDLFCGAGGAARGYQLAGFHVTGVDAEPQPNYCGDEFHQGDAMTILGRLQQDGRRVFADWGWLGRFDAIHASPPCQAYSGMSGCRPGLSEKYPDLVGPVRASLEASGIPWVIENVPGSPLIDPVVLCGQMFGLDLYRHRLFESNVPLTVPDHPAHTVPASKAGHWVPGTIMSVAGHVAPIAEARRVMGIDWTTRDELGEAIPPAYTFFIGAQLIDALNLAASRGTTSP